MQGSTRVKFPRSNCELVISVAVVVSRSRYLKGKVQVRTRLESLDRSTDGELGSLQLSSSSSRQPPSQRALDIMQVPAPIAAAVDPERRRDEISLSCK